MLFLKNRGATAQDVKGLVHTVHMAAERGEATVADDFFAPGTILPPGIFLVYKGQMLPRIPGGYAMNGDHPAYPAVAKPVDRTPSVPNPSPVPKAPEA